MHKIITSRICNGLGNMMFQIACGKAYSLRTDNSFVVIDELVEKKCIHPTFESFQNDIFSKLEIKKALNAKFNYFSENSFSFSEIPEIDDNLILDGYFQSEKYFNDYSKEIKDLFLTPLKEKCSPLLEKYKKIKSKKSCSIHVRRGDFLKLNDHHPVQEIVYYKKAIKNFDNEYTFYVFSNDINWCKENFNFKNLIFIENLSPQEDLFLMSQCSNNIIANSTFSWWGAWLNENENKKVIAPSKWFGKVYNNYNIDDLIPENWEKI